MPNIQHCFSEGGSQWSWPFSHVILIKAPRRLRYQVQKECTGSEVCMFGTGQWTAASLTLWWSVWVHWDADANVQVGAQIFVSVWALWLEAALQPAIVSDADSGLRLPFPPTIYAVVVFMLIWYNYSFNVIAHRHEHYYRSFCPFGFWLEGLYMNW